MDWPYIRGVGRIPMNLNNIQLFRAEIYASKKYDKEFEAGQLDRLQRLPCRSASGAYLDGWYSTQQQQARLP